jgi:type III secretion protein J
MSTKRFANGQNPRLRTTMVAMVLALCACKSEVDLHNGLTDAEANQVVAALRDDGVAAHKRPGKTGVTVSVTESDLSRANAVLSAQGLPHHTAARMGEVFKKEGLISSPLEERARYVYALSQELEATLGQIDGVVVARVHVVLPEKVGPGEPVQPPSAAVFIKHLPSLEPDAIAFRVRQLVARSIPGMGTQALDRVSAVFVKADPTPDRRPEPTDWSTLIWSTAAAALIAAIAASVFVLRKSGWRPRGKPAVATPSPTAG